MTEWNSFILNLEDFDPRNLPPGSPKFGSPDYAPAVMKHFEKEYSEFDVAVKITVDEHTLRIDWNTSDADKDPLEVIAAMLNKGRYSEAVPMLESVHERLPDNYPVLTMLGMAYSDMGRLDEAVALLQKASDI